MEQNDPNLPPTTFCRSGCGFYGSESFEGLCSKCYKDQIKRKNQSSSPVSSAGRASPAAPSLSAIGISSGSLQGEKDINCVSQALAKTNIGGLQQETGLASSNSPATSLNVSSTTPSVETATTTIQVPHVDKDSEESEAGAVGGAGCNDVAGMSPDTPKDKKKKNRCHTCKKKVGLTGFQCRCGGMFCSLHRYSDKHECTFNYKEMAQQQIRKNNPVIVGEKIAKI